MLAPLRTESGVVLDTPSSGNVDATLRTKTDAALPADVFGDASLAIGDPLSQGTTRMIPHGPCCAIRR